VIRAAGGVIVRVVADVDPAMMPSGGALELCEVLVVHRVAHDDWSLPKGHLDPGEDAAAAAVREVLEETGVHATILGSLPATRHLTSAGEKHVDWFLMAALDGDPQGRPADAEVDVARYVPASGLAELLTYPADLELSLLAVHAVMASRGRP